LLCDSAILSNHVVPFAVAVIAVVGAVPFDTGDVQTSTSSTGFLNSDDKREATAATNKQLANSKGHQLHVSTTECNNNSGGGRQQQSTHSSNGSNSSKQQQQQHQKQQHQQQQ